MGLVESILIGAAGSAAFDFTKETALAVARYLSSSRPDLVARIEGANASGNDNRLRDEIAGAIEVAAASGQIAISGAFISAIRSATFDHQHGTISIGGTTVSAPILVTGGGAGATGKTTITGGTSLRSSGTSIEVGNGASIVMTGGASIRQN